MVHSIAYLPLELKHRELDARMMTAAHLLNAGVAVVFGQQWAIFDNFNAWPPGLILFKTVNAVQARAMSYFHRLGYLVAATDEEVLTCVDDFSIALSPSALAHCHIFFAQNQRHGSFLEDRFPQMRGKIAVTGNPRVEMTSYDGRKAFKAEADDIRRRTGPYILLNTNYSGINSLWGDQQQVFRLLIKTGLLQVEDPNAPKRFQSMMDWETTNRNSMIAFLNWAADNLSGRKVVIRPHPSERFEYWQDIAGNRANVEVMAKSHHLPWIMASDLVVHTSCTTGLEAALLDKPVLNMVPAPDPLGERMTTLVNPTFTTSDEAIAAADSFLHKNTGPITNTGAFKDVIEGFFPGYHNGGPARRIAEECIGILEKHNAVDARRFDWQSVGPKYQQVARSSLRAEKFSLSLDEAVSALNAVNGKLGITRKVMVNPIDDSLFLFQPE